MNIGYLCEVLSQIEEITVIGRSAEVEGVVCHVMGILRQGMQMRLLILQYDEGFQSRIYEAEIAELCDIQDKPESNKQVLRGKVNLEPANPFQSVSRVFLGELEFEIHRSEYRRLSTKDLESVLLLSEFLRRGWKPEGIDFQSIDMLSLTSFELYGDHKVIPALGENLRLRFIKHRNSITKQVEQPVTLIVDGEYPDKLYFKDMLRGEKHWAQINRVYMSDMWAEMEKVFDSLKLQEQMTPEQIASAKSDFEKRFSKVCPRGMCFPIIEYECEEGISLQFYSQAYLDSPPVNSSSSMGFIIRPDNQTGILGLDLKAAVIQEPFSPNTKSIAAELFQYHRTSTSDDIVLSWDFSNI